MRLFIAEKPSVAKVIASELGIVKEEKGFFTCKNEDKVTYCFGHMLELCDPNFYLKKEENAPWLLSDLPVIPETFIKKESKTCIKQIKIIKNLLDQLRSEDQVVSAGDPDREGQLLIDELLEHLDYKGEILRYWQSAMDEVSVRRALQNIVPNSNYYSWGLAAKARAQADWLIGMNLTRFVTCTSNRGVKSVGRVQTPVLALVAKRNADIENFKAKDFFNLEATFKTIKSETFIGLWEIPEVLKTEGYVLDKNIIEEKIAQLQNKKAKIISYQQQLKKVDPPLPFDLAELQSECSKKFAFSAKKTLEIAQELYETHKLTSYPRSSCCYLPTSQKGDVPNILANLKDLFPDLQQYINVASVEKSRKVWDDKKVNAEAHTAIVPTLRKISVTNFSKLSEDCQKVYRLIATRYLLNFLDPYSYQEITIISTIEDAVFKSVGKVTVKAGFKALLKDEQEQITNTGSLPIVKENEPLDVIKFNCKTGSTKPPKYFTEGSLIKAMQHISSYISDADVKKILTESDGIGTAATRASILQTLKDRDYLCVNKGKLIVLEKGHELLQEVPKSLTSASLTAETEKNLKAIQAGELDLNSFMRLQKEQLQTFMKEAQSKVKEQTLCPNCQNSIRRYESKFKKGFFSWYCSKCKKKYSDIDGTLGEEIVQKKYLKCPKCNEKSLGKYLSKNGQKSYFFCFKCKKFFSASNELNEAWSKL